MTPREAALFLRRHAATATADSEVATAIAELLDHTMRLEQTLQLIEDSTQGALSRRPAFATISDRGARDLPIGPPAPKRPKFGNRRQVRRVR